MADYSDRAVSCRLCRNPLRASVGCAGCSELKRLLYWPADPRVTADELAQDLAMVMRTQLTKLTRQLNDQDDFNGRMVRELNGLGASLTKLLTEMRHSEALAAARVKTLSYDEQCDAILNEWLAYLPPEQVASFLTEAVKLTSATPLLLETNTNGH